jgi:mannose/cellobiose epimerase-like protein (N-acyl-D-glucosamine 2-epimerase family)
VTPHEHASANHIRQTFADGIEPGHLTEAIQALRQLRDGIDHRDALIAHIRDVADSATSGLIGAEAAVTQITDFINDFHARGNRLTQRGDA